MDLLPDTLLRDREASVADYVRELADRHSITYTQTELDRFAETASRLVGDDLAPPDETENLLVALFRAGVIDGPTRTRLLARHINQTAQ
jgi:hypothetical protein